MFKRAASENSGRISINGKSSPGGLATADLPYPDDPDCVAQWAHAEEFRQDQLDQGKLVKKPKGKGYGGFGDSYEKCLMGMVSERSAR